MTQPTVLTVNVPVQITIDVDEEAVGLAVGPLWLSRAEARDLAAAILAAVEEAHPAEDCNDGPDCPRHGGTLCGICGARYARTGYTACDTCA